jgi:hypothetical protein
MFKQIVLAAGILVTLGTAVSASLTSATPATSNSFASVQTNLSSTGALLAESDARANAPAFTPMARPL